jgi:arsenate reductase (glutaredoxin)
MEKITIYEKPTCTTCRKVVKILEEKGIDFEDINYYITLFTKGQLKSLLKKMDMTPIELLRKNEQAFKMLNIKEYSEEQILDLMLKNNDLIQRPIIEKGNKAILARPPEKIFELFD